MNSLTRPFIPRTGPALFGLLMITACDRGFDSMNVSPNAPTTVTADYLLPHGIYSAVDVYWGGSGVRTGSTVGFGQDVGNCFAQHWARIQYTSTDQYDISNEITDNTWRDFYTESLADFERVRQLSQDGNEPNYQAISLIMRSWVFSLLTDTYGDIPYTSALNGLDNGLSPQYDTQKDVYRGIIAELKSASEMIVIGSKPVSGDILYGGNMARWQKFANSLSLRLLNRQLGRADAAIDVKAEIERILADPAKYPVFTANADNASLVYLGSAPNNNPVNHNRITSNRDDHRVSKTLVDKLQALSDARLAIYADKPTAGGDYVGVPNGLNPSDANSLGLAKTSKVGTYFTAATAPGVIITYAELQLIKAEMAYRGVAAAGGAATNYTNGIRASFAQYGLTAGADYLDKVAYAGGAQGYRQILEQKWIALFGQGVEAWTEQRRTGIPALVVPATNYNNGVIPTRLPYPSSEESLNKVNFAEALTRQGSVNDKTFKLWWAQ